LTARVVKKTTGAQGSQKVKENGEERSRPGSHKNLMKKLHNKSQDGGKGKIRVTKNEAREKTLSKNYARQIIGERKKSFQGRLYKQKRFAAVAKGGGTVTGPVRLKQQQRQKSRSYRVEKKVFPEGETGGQ